MGHIGGNDKIAKHQPGAKTLAQEAHVAKGQRFRGARAFDDVEVPVACGSPDDESNRSDCAETYEQEDVRPNSHRPTPSASVCSVSGWCCVLFWNTIVVGGSDFDRASMRRVE